MTDTTTRDPAGRHADAKAPVFAGFVFKPGPVPAALAGVFILTCRVGQHLHAAFVGEADDMAAAANLLRDEDPDIATTEGLLYLPFALPRQRAYVARDLVGKLNPPLNIAHRTGPTAAALATVLPDRAADLFPAPATTDKLVVSETDLARFVARFYDLGDRDPIIGPLFRAIPDRAGHLRIVADFWSRGLLGTTRYRGNPFDPHRHLDLTPQSFDRWLALLEQAAGETLHPTAAARIMARARHMAESFQAGLFLPQPPPV
jgi:truncated hemoglobin YjbI